MGKGRCRRCGRVWCWPGTSGEPAVCPGCQEPLASTSKRAETQCTRTQVGLPEDPE